MDESPLIDKISQDLTLHTETTNVSYSTNNNRTYNINKLHSVLSKYIAR